LISVAAGEVVEGAEAMNGRIEEIIEIVTEVTEEVRVEAIEAIEETEEKEVEEETEEIEEVEDVAVEGASRTPINTRKWKTFSSQPLENT